MTTPPMRDDLVSDKRSHWPSVHRRDGGGALSKETHMKAISMLGTCACLSCAVSAEVIMDHMAMIGSDTYNYANGNAIGGEGLFGFPSALQICDDFATTSTGYIITQVEVANTFVGVRRDPEVEDVRISIFPDDGGVPGEEAVYTARFSEQLRWSPAAAPGVRNIHFEDGIWGGEGVWTIVSGLWVPLEPNTKYFICVQVYCGPDDWAYTIRDDLVTGADSYVRDGPPDEGEGGYGTTTWQSAGDWLNNRPGDSAYRIVAVGW